MNARLPLAPLLALSLLAGSTARAEPLRIDRSAEAMRVDGALKEWRGARFTELGQGDDARVRYALATTDEGLFVGAEIADDKLVPGDGGDALVLTLAMPEQRGMAVSELWLYPGASGQKARARLGSGAGPVRAEPRVQVVEGPRSQGAGYVIEARIPWAVVRGAEIWEQGRGGLRFVDVDAKKPEITLESARAGSPGELPRLALGTGQVDLLGAFFQAKRLSAVEPRYDFRADVSGDARPERVVVLDQYVVVYGPGYRRGETYGYFALPFGTGGGLKSAELLDLTGDGRVELVATLRQVNHLGGRELWQVLSLDDDTIAPLFAVELRKERKGGFVENALTLVTKGQRVPRIDVKVGRALGLDASTYPPEEPRSDAQPILLPWGDVQARGYAYDGKRFAVVAEEKRPPAPAVAPAAATPLRTESPTIVRGPSTGELLAQARADLKLAPSEAPRFTLRANVLGGAAPEQVDVLGKVLVVTGADVGQGRGYLTYVAPVAAPADVLDVRAAEVTGDATDELLVRGRQAFSSGAQREILIVLRGDESGRIARVLTAEVARRQGRGVIENRVVPQRGALVIEPGRVEGWAKDSYPFAVELPSELAPLRLPWRDRAVRYRLQGGVLVPAP